MNYENKYESNYVNIGIILLGRKSFHYTISASQYIAKFLDHLAYNGFKEGNQTDTTLISS